MLQEEPSKQASSSVTKPKSHECKKCKKVFSKVSLLNRHMKLHLGIKPFQCNVSLLENICVNWQSNDLCSWFLCQICGWRFLQSYNLKKHIQTHGNKSLRCSQCKASFPDKAHLRAHVLRKHNQVNSILFQSIPVNMMQNVFFFRESRMRRPKCRWTVTGQYW